MVTRPVPGPSNRSPALKRLVSPAVKRRASVFIASTMAGPAMSSRESADANSCETTKNESPGAMLKVTLPGALRKRRGLVEVRREAAGVDDGVGEGKCAELGERVGTVDGRGGLLRPAVECHRRRRAAVASVVLRRDGRGGIRARAARHGESA